MSKTADPEGRRVFRSPSAVAIWWLWVLFAVGNLIDLAIQGRDHSALVAAVTLIAVTGVVYVTAQRPRIIAEADGLTIVNPVRVHRVAWTAVAGFDTTDLLRVHCAWPAQNGTATGGTEEQKRVIYSWAVRSSRRGQIAAEARAKRQAARGRGSGRVGLGFGAPPPNSAPPPAPLGLDSAKVAGALTERAEKARASALDRRAVPPLSEWHWPSAAAVVVPALALVIAVLA